MVCVIVKHHERRMEGYAAAKAGISHFAEIRSFVTETGRRWHQMVSWLLFSKAVCGH